MIGSWLQLMTDWVGVCAGSRFRTPPPDHFCTNSKRYLPFKTATWFLFSGKKWKHVTHLGRNNFHSKALFFFIKPGFTKCFTCVRGNNKRKLQLRTVKTLAWTCSKIKDIEREYRNNTENGKKKKQRSSNSHKSLFLKMSFQKGFKWWIWSFWPHSLGYSES